ncbi:hypothetical protein OG937_46225 [Streptomyces sp. NBC_00510]
MNRDALRAAVVDALADVAAAQEKLTGLLADIDGTEAAVNVPRQGRWTGEQVELLWGKVKHLAGVRALFEATAAKPGDTVTFAELLNRSGLDEQQQRNEHARLSRIAADLFGEKRWPIENWQGGYDGDTGKAQMIYRIDAQVAEWWLGLAQ